MLVQLLKPSHHLSREGIRCQGYISIVHKLCIVTEMNIHLKYKIISTYINIDIKSIHTVIPLSKHMELVRNLLFSFKMNLLPLLCLIPSVIGGYYNIQLLYY